MTEKSNGTLKLQVEKLSYNYFTRRMVIKNAVFFPADSTRLNTSHRFDVPEIRVTLKRVLPFLTEKRLLIEYLNLNAPDITVIRLRNNQADLKPKSDSSEVSVPYEMGQVYKSIQKALQEL